ncbi:cupin domain-containing protein [Streptomyces sp. NPDC004667]|uniref:cupin domain-containing protein n=1 Tax=Streptomyces sp. NPDC004667 TaxID=3154285 RepID=UPI0033A7FDF6
MTAVRKQQAGGIVRRGHHLVETGQPASAPSCVETRTLAHGEGAEGFELSVQDGPCHTVVQRIVIQPGADTGWHYHPGDVFAVVAQGELTHYDAIGRVNVHPAGTSFLEPSGMIHAHLGRNEGDEPVVMYATYVSPVGQQLTLPVPVVAREKSRAARPGPVR